MISAFGNRRDVKTPKPMELIRLDMIERKGSRPGADRSERAFAAGSGEESGEPGAENGESEVRTWGAFFRRSCLNTNNL